MHSISWVEWLGYIASLLVLLSMLMNSILKLRVVNLIGSSLFAVYGLIINAIPVFIVNGTIALINVYYLVKFFFASTDVFKSLEVRGNSYYLREFLKFYNDDIKKYFPHFTYEPEKNRYSFFVLRNMNVAGIFMAREMSPGVLLVTLDYTIPAYRDFKVGKFVYNDYAKKFLTDGYTKIIAFPSVPKHNKYLHKMGFVREQMGEQSVFVKRLVR